VDNPINNRWHKWEGKKQLVKSQFLWRDPDGVKSITLTATEMDADQVGLAITHSTALPLYKTV
jgi:hypothetical protein